MNTEFTIVSGFGENRERAEDFARHERTRGLYAEALERPIERTNRTATDDDDPATEWVVVVKGE